MKFTTTNLLLSVEGNIWNKFNYILLSSPFRHYNMDKNYLNSKRVHESNMKGLLYLNI